MQHHLFLNNGFALDPTTGQYVVRPVTNKKRKLADKAEEEAVKKAKEQGVDAAQPEGAVQEQEEEEEEAQPTEPVAKKPRVTEYEPTYAMRAMWVPH